jgi:hypothetical protein
MGMLLHESVSVKVGIQGPLILSFSPKLGPKWGRGDAVESPNPLGTAVVVPMTNARASWGLTFARK